MHIQVIQEQSFPIHPDSVRELVAEFARFYQITFDEATIYFVDTAKISALHQDFFNDPTTTDCISFPMDDEDAEGYRILGDVFVCPETAISYVNTHGGDVYHEITLYVVHGFLHLLGYDDIEDTDRQEMRDEEARFLSHVASKSLWIKASS